MDCPARPPSPALVTVTDILDPTLASEGTELIDVDAVQLQSTPMRAQRTVLDLDGATVLGHATRVRIRTRTRLRPDLIALTALGPKARGKISGLAARPGLILLAAPGAEVDFVTDGDWESLTCLVARDELLTHLEVRGGGIALPASGAVMLQLEPAAARRFFDWGSRLLDTALNQPLRLEPGRPGRVLARVELLEQVLTVLREAGPLEPWPGDRTREAYGRIVRAAEEYALARHDEAVYVTDLCRAAGTRERTLEHAFKQILGISPVSYLARLRLHRAREDLLAAAPRSTTVTTIALRWGFWHLGGFSRAYKECFGESPSETLRGAERAHAVATKPGPGQRPGSHRAEPSGARAETRRRK